ncbi:MAG: hypothetical protein EP149_00965 [Phascolarctobacterium sp.]|nr:hypothetical protein [Phascolarctobacterium sp.]
MNAGDSLYIEATSITQADGARARVDAVNNLYGAETAIGDDLVIAAKAKGTTGEIKVMRSIIIKVSLKQVLTLLLQLLLPVMLITVMLMPGL